jgi:hypothetical protein
MMRVEEIWPVQEVGIEIEIVIGRSTYSDEKDEEVVVVEGSHELTSSSSPPSWSPSRVVDMIEKKKEREIVPMIEQREEEEHQRMPACIGMTGVIVHSSDVQL